MVQVVPQFAIQQVFSQVPSATTNALRALVMGPDYVVRKYDNGKEAVSLGTYADEDLTVAWPGRLAGEVVDQAFSTVQIDQANCVYATDDSGDSESVTDEPNQVVNSGLNWATNGSFARSEEIPCDVQVGDYCRLTDGDSNVLVTSITALIADVVAAVIGTVAAVGGNAATDGGSDSTSAGGGNAGTAGTTISGLNNPANYAGEFEARMSETYTLTVTNVGSQGTGIAGDWTTVTLSCVSASDTDAPSVVVPIPGTPIAIGSRGARVEFDHGGSGDDFVNGDTFQVAVVQTYTIPTPVEGGTYTGPSDTTYTVSVTRGGKIDGGTDASERAQVSVTTSTGIDVGGPLTVLSGAALVLGQYGVTLTLTGDMLVLGDEFTIAVAAETPGDIHTLVLANDLPFAMREVALTVELGITKDITVSKNRTGHAPEVNWSGDATEITLKSGILTTDDRVDADLEVVSGHAYVSYRALRTAGSLSIVDVSTTEDITDNFAGLDDPDTGLSYGLYRALAGAGGTTVKALPIGSDDLTGYEAAIVKLKEREDVYRMVALTHDELVIDAVVAEAQRRSGTDVGRWATTMIALAVNRTTAVISTGTLLATISDVDDDANYVIVEDESGQFITAGVRPGDVFRAVYASDGFGNASYQSFVIDSVESENRLTLISGPASAVTVASVYQIWRDLSVAEQAAEWVTRAQARSDHRVTAVFPDLPSRGGVAQPSYFLACTLAAMRCSAAPHQGLTLAEVPDWDDLTQASETFGGQLDTLANGGAYIVTESPTGQIYIRKQLTTDLSDVNHAEDSATTNFDSISYYFKNLIAPRVGRTNVVPTNLDGIRADLKAGISYLKTAGFTTELGAQLTDATLDFVRQHATLRDHVVAQIDATDGLPLPLNNGLLTIVV